MQRFRTRLSFGISLVIITAATAAVVAADSAPGNRLNFGSSSSGGSSGASSGNSLGNTSRSVSFNENGKQFTIKEDSSGITITRTETIDGKEKKIEVQAANAKELKAKSPVAHRLYEHHLGGTTATARASGGSGASSRSEGMSGRTGGGSSWSSGGSSGGGRSGGSGRGSSGGGSSGSRAGGGGSRSTSFTEGGKKVHITESTDSGITVTITETVNGKEKKYVVTARNAQELEKQDPEAYRLYNSRMDSVPGGASASGGAGGADARDILREQLRKQIGDNAGNPQMKAMLEQMLRELDK
jgi:hypothetical protein